MKGSVYDNICDNIIEGKLDKNFILEFPASGLNMVPGAMDGMYIYHMYPEEPGEDEVEIIEQAINMASEGHYNLARKTFEQLTENIRTITFSDKMLQYVIDDSSSLNSDNLCKFAYTMALLTQNAECVKVGLALLEIFDPVMDELKEVIRRFGLYDEFTLFSILNMMHWKDGNQEIFDLAKKVHGWGRIHAVSRLKPETKEIRHWLLTEGTVNDISYSYSCIDCWEKSGAEKVLYASPSQDEFEGLCTLIRSLLEDGPVTGIYSIENSEDVLMKFLEISRSYDLSVSNYDLILTIRNWAADQKYACIVNNCDLILHSRECAESVENAVEEGKHYFSLADEAGISYQPYLMEMLRRDFDNEYYNIEYLMKSAEYIDKVLDLYREKIPISLIKKGDIRGLKGRQVEKLIYNLENCPGYGADFIIAGLESHFGNLDFRGITALKKWVCIKGKPLQEVSPYAAERLKVIGRRCFGAQMDSDIEKLLNGVTYFSDVYIKKQKNDVS